MGSFSESFGIYKYNKKREDWIKSLEALLYVMESQGLKIIYLPDRPPMDMGTVKDHLRLFYKSRHKSEDLRSGWSGCDWEALEWYDEDLGVAFRVKPCVYSPSDLRQLAAKYRKIKKMYSNDEYARDYFNYFTELIKLIDELAKGGFMLAPYSTTRWGNDI